MESYNKYQKSFEALQESAGMGCWFANRKDRMISLSSFLMRKLKLEHDKLSFDTFKTHLHPENQDSVLTTLRRYMITNKTGEVDFLFRTEDGYQPVRVKINGCVVEAGEVVSAEGFLSCLATAETPISTNKELNRILRWQKRFTQSLAGLLDKSTSDDALEKVLDLILQNYNADAIRIYSVDYDKHILNCLYETVANGTIPTKAYLQNIKFNSESWDSIIMGRRAKFEDEVPEEFYKESKLNKSVRATKAYMAIPLISKDGIWGFVKLDMVNSPRKWSILEKETFHSIADIIGVCLAFRQSESTALSSGDFLHKLFFNMPLGYFNLRIEQNSEGTVTDYEYRDVNTKFTEMVGMTREQLVGKMHTEIGPIFVKKLDLQILARVAFKGEVYYTQGQMRYNQRYYNTTIYSPRYGDIVALFSDVTDTVLASEALTKSEEELKKVYTNIPVGIEMYDKNGVLIEVNEKELEILCVKSKDELLGLNLFDHPSLPKSAYDLLKAGKDATFDVAAEAMQTAYTYYGVEDARINKYLSVKCNVLYNSKGEVENYLLIVIDNTQMYQASAQVREFEAVFNTVAEIAEIGLFRWNPLKGESYGTEQYVRNMGLTPEEANDFLIFQERVHPNDVEVLQRFLDDAIAGRTNSITYDFRVSDGEQWKWLRTACFITEYEPEKNNVQFLGVNYNINEIKVGEQKLLEAKSRAEEADRLKTAFLANMSHEIRTPLNAIVGFSGILVETDDKEDQQQFISIIKKNNDHLLNLISDILDISKVEAGTVDITTGYLMAEDICTQVVDSLSIKNEMGLDMRFIPNADMPNVLMESDAKRITQILSNFIANALKFTRQGHVWLSYKIVDKEIEFSVEDTGIGIAGEHISNLFDRFFKVDDFVPGTGLGLSICKTIAERLSGTVGVESTLGVGSRFWLRLPIMFQYF